MAEVLLTPEQVAVRLGLASKTVKDHLRAGKLKGVKVGGGRFWRVRESDLERHIKKLPTGVKRK